MLVHACKGAGSMESSMDSSAERGEVKIRNFRLVGGTSRNFLLNKKKMEKN